MTSKPELLNLATRANKVALIFAPQKRSENKETGTNQKKKTKIIIMELKFICVK